MIKRNRKMEKGFIMKFNINFNELNLQLDINLFINENFFLILIFFLFQTMCPSIY